MHSWRRRMANVRTARTKFWNGEKPRRRGTLCSQNRLECNKIPFYDRIAMSVFIFLINFRCCFASICLVCIAVQRTAFHVHVLATRRRIEIEIEHFIGYWKRQITPNRHTCTHAAAAAAKMPLDGNDTKINSTCRIGPSLREQQTNLLSFVAIFAAIEHTHTHIECVSLLLPRHQRIYCTQNGIGGGRDFILFFFRLFVKRKFD